MADVTRESKVREYFAPADAPKPPMEWRGTLAIGSVSATLLVSVLVFSGNGFLTLFLLFAGIGVLAGAAHRYVRDNPTRPIAAPFRRGHIATDEEIDVWLREGIAEITEAGYSRLDIVEDDLAGTRPGQIGAAPLVVQGMANPAHFDVLFKTSNGVTRYSHYEIMVIYLTGWHLCVYSSVLDIATAMSITDKTTEFHYQDVVSITTSSDRIRGRVGDSAPNPGEAPRAAIGSEILNITTKQAFCIRVPGDDISMFVGLTGDARIGRGDLGKNSGIDTALQQIRTMLNTYKNRALENPPSTGLSHL